MWECKYVGVGVCGSVGMWEREYVGFGVGVCGTGSMWESEYVGE